MTFLTMALIFVPAQAQFYFNFGSSSSIPRADCPVVAFLHTGTNYQVSTTVTGFVFDDSQQYSLQLASQNFSNPTITENTGFFHCNQQGNNPSMPYGDVAAKFPELLGAGRYQFAMNDGSTTLSIEIDLTDANWADGTGGSADFRSILIEPDFISNPKVVKVWISLDSRISTEMKPVVNHTTPFYYWKMVRNHPPALNYPRDRTGFIIDPNYGQNTDEIPYGISSATLDVDVSVRDDIVVPSGKTFRVTTDPDIINSPSVEQTQLDFDPGTGLNVENGGTLITIHADPYGVIDWFCTQDSDKGGWRGIVGEPGGTISLQNSLVIGAEVGLTLEQTNTHDLLAVLIEDSKDIGMHVIDCSPQVEVWAIIRSGVSSGVNNAVNVKIEGASSEPYFHLSAMTDAVQVNSGGTVFGGHGVEITGSDRAEFHDCTIANNEGNGFFIHETIGPYIWDSQIRGNRNGIHVLGGSYWTTLRESRVYDHTNGAGILLEGSSDGVSARIAGWHHLDLTREPSTQADVDAIVAGGDVDGNNCLWNNWTNVRSYSLGRFDLGSEYRDGWNNLVTLGGQNTIVNPVSQWQGLLNHSSYGGFQSVFWNGNMAFDLQNNSSVDLANPLGADQLGCPDMGKRQGEEAGSMVADMLLYRRTRGTMRLPEPDQPTSTSTAAQPVTAWLSEPYPNPFNPTTKLAVTVFKGQSIRLSVTDMLGREVAVPLDGAYEPGRYTVDFNAVHLPSGMYNLVLHSGDGVQSRRLLLTK